MKVVLNGEPPSSRDGATVEAALDVARPARRGPRRRGRRRRRGRPARAVGRDTNCTKGRGWRSCARSREAEMAVTDTNTDVLTIAGTDAALAAAARHRRVPLARRAGRRAGGRPARELVTVALRRIDPAQRGSIVDVLDRAGVQLLPEHRGLLHRPRRGADRQARPRGVRDRLGQARGDRRRAHAAARRARAAGGRRGARRRRLRRPARTPTTTRSSRAAWRTSAAPR